MVAGGMHLAPLLQWADLEWAVAPEYYSGSELRRPGQYFRTVLPLLCLNISTKSFYIIDLQEPNLEIFYALNGPCPA